jgi:hypothetical protein
LNSDETVEVPSSVVVDKVNKPVPVVPAPQPVVAPTPPKQPVVVSESSVEDVNATQVVESNEVGQSQNEDESSEEQGLGGGVEALVPGYVTDQGEVLVPVDTVTGDQPISIVPGKLLSNLVPFQPWRRLYMCSDPILFLCLQTLTVPQPEGFSSEAVLTPTVPPTTRTLATPTPTTTPRAFTRI